MEKVWCGMKRDKVGMTEDWMKQEEREAKKQRIFEKIKSRHTEGGDEWEVQTVVKYRMTRRGLVIIDNQVINKKINGDRNVLGAADDAEPSVDQSEPYSPSQYDSPDEDMCVPIDFNVTD